MRASKIFLFVIFVCLFDCLFFGLIFCISFPKSLDFFLGKQQKILLRQLFAASCMAFFAFPFLQWLLDFRHSCLSVVNPTNESLSKISCSETFHPEEEKKIGITELIIAFLGSLAIRKALFVCFKITIFNFKHETTGEQQRRRIKKCAHNRINFNDQWAFAFLFFLKKKVILHTRIQETN